MKDLGRVLFARIGWMNYYKGIMPGDARITGGGAWNLENEGSEIFNFHPVAGSLRGYAQPPYPHTSHPSYSTKLERIDAEASHAKRLPHVLVVFVAKGPGVGQVVVGWYQDATVLRRAEEDPLRAHDNGDTRYYNFVGRAKQAVLLPPSKRSFSIPKGVGGIGQSNLCYPLDERGGPKRAAWMNRAVAYVRSYRGANLLVDPLEEEQQEAVRAFDRVRAGGQGQGFAPNPKQRKAIERHAMAAADKHFRQQYSQVEDVSAVECYDLHCSGQTSELRVEVKGTTGSGDTVFLTRREVELARKGGCALFVLHSIKLKKNRASGGEPVVPKPWHVGKRSLQPLAFSYKVPKA